MAKTQAKSWGDAPDIMKQKVAAARARQGSSVDLMTALDLDLKDVTK